MRTEPNRSGFSWNARNRLNIFIFISLSPRRGGDRSRTLLWSSWEPRPEIHLTIKERGREENIKGQLNATLWHCIYMRWSLGGRHCVERREAQPRTRDGPWGQECDGDPGLRITARRVRDTRSGRGLRGGSAVVYLDSPPHARPPRSFTVGTRVTRLSMRPCLGGSA